MSRAARPAARPGAPGPARAVGFRRVSELRESPDRAAAVQQAVARAQAGDRDALQFLYVQYADNVYGYVLSLLPDEHEAEDGPQQVCAKLMTVLPKYGGRDTPFASWIMRLAHNAAFDMRRRRRAIPFEEVRP